MGGDILRTVVGISTLGMSEIAYYGPKAQEKAAKDAQAAQTRAEMEARRIAASKKPLEESATMALQTEQGSTLESLGLMTTPDYAKRKTGLGTGSTASSTLGFGS